jgi:NitT/TauT family transport system substrate-binding protein
MDRKLSRRDALSAIGVALATLSAPRAKAAETLRVGKAVQQNPGYIPLDVGMQFGLFANEGLEIQELNFTGGAKLAQGVSAGAVDIALAGGPDMAFVTKGAPEIAIASITASPAFMGIFVGSQSTAKSADDLRGKKIGVTSPGSVTYWLVDELNRVKGWTGADRARPVVVGGSPTSAFAALKTGEVDAGTGAVEEGFELEERHEGRLLLNASDYVPDLELFVTFASNDIIKKNPGAVRRFLKAWYDSVAFMRGHRAETVQVLRDVIGYSPAIAARAYDTSMPLFSTDGRFEPKALDTLRRSFIDLKVLDSGADLSKLYTEAYLPKRPS